MIASSFLAWPLVWWLGTREGLMRGEVFLRASFLKDVLVNFCFVSHLFVCFSRGFFVEGSILAQDERWRRA